MLLFPLLIIFTLLYFALFVIRLRKSDLWVSIFKLPNCFEELPVIGIAHLLLKKSEELMAFIFECGDAITKKGGTCRIWGLNYFYIALTDASDAAKILKDCLEKDYMYRFLRLVSTGSIFSPAAIWKGRRKVVSPVFSTRMTTKSVDIFYKNSIRLVDVLESIAGTGPFSVKPYINAYNFDSISGITFGIDGKAQGNEDLFFKAFNRSFEHVSERITHIWMHPDFVYKWLPQCADLNKNVNILNNCITEATNKRRLQIKENFTIGNISDQSEHIIDFLLQSSLNDEEILDECKIIYGAMDTSTITIGFVLKLLGLYPHIQDKIYEELHNIFGDSDRAIDKDDIPELIYMDRVVKETLRLFPPVPVIMRKVTEEVTLPSGYVIPPEAGVVVFVIGLHRNPKYWGPDAEHFDPDRFLPKRIEKIDPNAYIPFSSGPRNCIGYKYGMFSVKIALATILRKYKIVGQAANSPIPDIKTKFGIFITPVDDFLISLEKRQIS